jgi:hypothetical protein
MQRDCVRDRVCSHELNLTAELVDSLSDEIAEIEVMIMREPVTCAEDFAAKMITDTARGEFFRLGNGCDLDRGARPNQRKTPRDLKSGKPPEDRFWRVWKSLGHIG